MLTAHRTQAAAAPALAHDPHPATPCAARQVLLRQPIVDRRGRPRGWSIEPVLADDATAAPATSIAPEGVRLLAGLLDGAGIGAEPDAPGALPLLVPVDAALLATPWVDLLDAHRVVLRLAPDLAPDADALQRVAALATQGFAFALDEDGLGAAQLAAWLPRAAYVMVRAERLQAFAPLASGNALRRHGARIVALDIDTPEQLEQALGGGLDLFQGRHFVAPRQLMHRTLSPAQQAILRALYLAHQDAPPGRIEQALKLDAALVFRLLRYLNAAGIGNGRPVRSVGEAVAMLGYRRLSRWLGVMLVCADETDPTLSVLARTALARARMMELLAADDAPDCDAEQRFLAGLFSLLDAMLGLPIEQALAHLPLSEPLRQALLARAGPLGALLRLVESCEQAARHRQRPGAAGRPACPAPLQALDAAHVQTLNAAHLAAIDWADRTAAG